MNIKAGDWIKVCDDLKIGEYYGGFQWHTVMECCLKGRMFSVLKVCSNNNVLIQTDVLDNVKFYLTPEMVAPHTRYEQIQQMSVEEMAKHNIRMVDTAWTTAYITSDGNTFDAINPIGYDKALQYEIDWLKSEV